MSEIIQVVDRNDNFLRTENRKKVHSNGDWHRGAHVFLFGSENRILLQGRSSSKNQYPSKYDCSVSEHVKENETFKKQQNVALEKS